MTGAVLRYDVREGGSADEPPLLMIGSPMGATSFALASHFPDRTVVTYDPRGVERSERGATRAPPRPPSSTPTTCTA